MSLFSVRVAADPDHPYAIGIDLGGTSVKAALVEREKGAVTKKRLPTEPEKGPEHIIDRIAELAHAMADEAPDRSIAGIGLGSPGAINWDRTTVIKPPNFPGWDEIDVRAALQERFGDDHLPVIVENDASAAGLGSAFYGAGKPFPSFIMITLGTGVGGAIIHENRIFRGTTGGAAEIGHMTIDYEGPYARSGVAGAIEAYLGQEFLTRHARYQLLRRETTLHETAGPDLQHLSPKKIYEAAKEGDDAATDMLAWAGHKLGCVLGSAVNLLDIRKIVVGGGVSGAGDFLLDPARRTLTRFVMPALRDDLEIVRETRGNAVGTLGAAHLVFAFLDE